MRAYNYCDVVLPVLLKSNELEGVIRPYYRNNGVCGTVTAHGDKWMEDRKLTQYGIPEYKQICLYLVFRCSDRDDTNAYKHEDVCKFIKETFEKVKHLLPNQEDTIVQIAVRRYVDPSFEDSCKHIWYEYKARYGFDGENWSGWITGQCAKKLIKEYKTTDYWSNYLYHRHFPVKLELLNSWD